MRPSDGEEGGKVRDRQNARRRNLRQVRAARFREHATAHRESPFGGAPLSNSGVQPVAKPGAWGRPAKRRAAQREIWWRCTPFILARRAALLAMCQGQVRGEQRDGRARGDQDIGQGEGGWSRCSCPPWQCLSSPPVPYQRAPGGSGRLGTPRVGSPATASGAQASCLRSGRCHCVSPSGEDPAAADGRADQEGDRRDEDRQAAACG